MNTQVGTDVQIYDTSLRDGAQAEGISFSVADKMKIAERLYSFGVQFIEGGWPGSNPKDAEFFRLARSERFHSKLAAFGSTRMAGVKVEADKQVRLIAEADTPIVAIVGKGAISHVLRDLRATPDENLAMVKDTVGYFRAMGKFVVFDVEHAFDGYLENQAYLMEVVRAAEAAGASVICLCDTRGGSLMKHVAMVTRQVDRAVKCAVGIHTHNDTGLALANALVAIDAGASHVQGTINGYGERVGNCNLIELIPALSLKLARKCVSPEALSHLRELSLFFDQVANMRHYPRQPWVGDSAFAHKGGRHVAAVERDPQSYEHADPASVGNRRRILVSELSGKTNVELKAKELGVSIKDKSQAGVIATLIKAREKQGFEFEAADGSLALLMRSVTEPERKPAFEVLSYHVSARGDRSSKVCEATLKVRVGDNIRHTVFEGDGPVHALDGALRAALVKSFPRLEKVSLVDYKVRILDNGGGGGTASTTRVLVFSSDGEKEWGTVGVDDNIIAASLRALVDSMEFALG